MLSRELEQATGSVGNADASFFAEWVDGGGGGGGGGGDDCGDGNGEGGGGEGDSGESSRASIGLIFVLDVTLLDGGVVCSRTKSSADSRAIQTAQHTSAKMLHRGSVSRCLGLATRGLASIPPAPSGRSASLWRGFGSPVGARAHTRHWPVSPRLQGAPAWTNKRHPNK